DWRAATGRALWAPVPAARGAHRVARRNPGGRARTLARGGGKRPGALCDTRSGACSPLQPGGGGGRPRPPSAPACGQPCGRVGHEPPTAPGSGGGGDPPARRVVSGPGTRPRENPTLHVGLHPTRRGSRRPTPARRVSASEPVVLGRGG